MVGLRKVEDRPTPSAVYNWRVYLCAIVAATAAIMIGYDSAFIGTSIATTAFKKEFGLLAPKTSAARFATISANSEFSVGGVVSTYQGGCFFGALLGYPAGVLLGRKWGLLLSALVFCLGAGVMLAADDGARGLGPIYAGRIVAGLGIGAASNLTPLYISEIAPPAIRGQLVGMYECGWQIGGLVGFWINYGISKHIPVSNKQWIIPFAIQLLPGGLFAIGIPLFIKESPRWLLSIGRRDEAIKNLCYLRQLSPEDPYIIEEVNMIDIQIQHDIAAVGEGFWAPFRQVFTRWDLTKRLLIVTTLFAFQNGTGINAINYYSPTIFKSIGIQGSQTGLLTTGIFGVIKTIGGFAWTFLIIDHFGRRGILLVGAIGGAAAMAVIAGYNHIGDPANHPRASGDLPAGDLAAMVFFYVWTAFYAVSWNGTPWVVCSEVFPGAVRMVTTMFAAAANWLYNFAIARATPTMFLKMGHSGWGVYLFFCICQIISVPYIIFLLPETKHVPLEEMDRLWQLSPWTANQKVMSELRREHDVSGQEGPAYIHQDKNQGSDERFESSSEKNTV
ncbi:BZ3500_MvSof-1268-A1-R1_Chr8-2g10156 [Microbotryum saponariae]|uniref:Quinate transporter n=1 Tax=Microbotryum saponariae TaxID=289078 RepID=A0A2X0MPY3_9BASI|nr:BZ3500_MvSof-1268-A1-R1_Chr8-2g10156 [Microbotryum saponariae]SDA01895.1 BZ3501_MvSof-1269-A2-R1_Chr8-2g09907 [Microbotryum saponariae]